MFNSFRYLGEKFFGPNEEGSQSPIKKAKISLDNNYQSGIPAAKDNPNLFAELPDEIKVNIFSYCDSETLKSLILTNRDLYGLMTHGEKGDGALEYNIPFFSQPLTWREMSNKFNEKAAVQWEEVQQAIKGRILSPQELKFNRPATNIKEYNEVEELLNETNIAIIKEEINDNNEFFNDDGGHLNLWNLSLTRFPLKQLFKEEEVKAFFHNLSTLRLNNNKIRGPIPKELGQLNNLQYLSFSSNQLSGPIPTELRHLANLKGLWLDGNQLSGFIPSELGQLINLDSLNLSNNQLNGPIPPELRQLSNLKSLLLNGNQLSGTIPSEIGQLINLVNFSLANNQLSGYIPFELRQLSNLEGLWLDRNQLSGPALERLAQRFPQLVNFEGYIAGQQVVEEESTSQPSLRP